MRREAWGNASETQGRRRFLRGAGLALGACFAAPAWGFSCAGSGANEAGERSGDRRIEVASGGVEREGLRPLFERGRGLAG